MGNQWHLDAGTYARVVREEIRGYDELQTALAAATTGLTVERILDLGAGTGITAQQVLAVHPHASLTGIDASADMVAIADTALPQAEFRVSQLEDPLPVGPFDVVVSAFAIHHLEGVGKSELFRRVAEVLRPGGRFVMLDVVVPTHDVAHPVPLEAGVDRPSSVDEQLEWLHAAGLDPTVVWAEDDLAILAADRLLERPS